MLPSSQVYTVCSPRSVVAVIYIASSTDGCFSAFTAALTCLCEDLTVASPQWHRGCSIVLHSITSLIEDIQESD